MRQLIYAILLLPALGAAQLHAENLADGPTEDNAQARKALHSYRQAIANAEASQGAYAAQLAEPLLGLGLALQAQGRHREAIRHFKRGVHVARINDGLYSPRQIPLLQREIDSHIALGDYEQVDERQRYLYRVQLQSAEREQALSYAYMQHADWQAEAYRLGIGEEDYSRLVEMWDLYRLALNDVMEREGESSINLLAPLHGMLRAQYLIANYNWQTEATDAADNLRTRQSLYRFSAYQNESYSKGTSIIEAMLRVQMEQEPGRQRSLSSARLLAQLGDWHLWHRKRDAAWQAYGAALAELAALADAQTQTTALFGAPVALPDIEGLRPLPPAVPTGPDTVLIPFGVTDTGRAVNIERLDDNDSLDGRAYRLMRNLRQTRFRPRFEAGQPVGTEQIVKAFDLQ